MKKVICLLVVLCIMLSPTGIFAEESDAITITVNGIELEADTAPYIKNDRTMVPMRVIFEALGAFVTWDDNTKTAIGTKDNKEIKITIGENKLYKNGEAIEIDCPAEIVNDHTMVPVRAVSEAFGALVDWDNNEKTVHITKNDSVKIIRIGTHSIADEDPNQGYMSPEMTESTKKALDTVKEKLGVEIRFVQYSGNFIPLIKESMEKGERLCELAVLWNGSQKTAIESDILQPIDKYLYLFDEENMSFPLQNPIKGKHYFMKRDFVYTTSWPIIYNISMLDKIPELKEEDGTTLYPAEMYYRGEWTWSGFEKYMSIIKEYCEKFNSSNTLTNYKVKPFETNYTFFAREALYSAGAGIYDGESVKIGTVEALEAYEFTEKLFKEGLVSCATAEKHASDSGWISAVSDFSYGKTFFTNCATWKMDEMNPAVGIVPFPYPDDDKNAYSHVNSGGDSVGLVKGVDEETSRLAVMAYEMYKVELYKNLADAENMSQFADKYAVIDAKNRGIDVTHPEIGEYHAKIWAELGKTEMNDYSEAFGYFWKWGYAFGESVFEGKGVEGYKEAVSDIK